MSWFQSLQQVTLPTISPAHPCSLEVPICFRTDPGCDSHPSDSIPGVLGTLGYPATGTLPCGLDSGKPGISWLCLGLPFPVSLGRLSSPFWFTSCVLLTLATVSPLLWVTLSQRCGTSPACPVCTANLKFPASVRTPWAEAVVSVALTYSDHRETPDVEGSRDENSVP